MNAKAMGRIKHICETCAKWDRDNMMSSPNGPLAKCKCSIYARYWYDKCKLWEKNEKK